MKVASARQILEFISPAVIDREIVGPNLRTRESYRQERTPGKFEEFKEAIGRYYEHQFLHSLSAPSVEFPTQMASQAAIEILDRYYPGGHKAAASNSMNNRNGGIIHVFNAIRDSVIADEVEKYISHIHHMYVDTTNFGQLVALAREYRKMFKDVYLGDGCISEHMLAMKFASGEILHHHYRWLREYMRIFQ